MATKLATITLDGVDPYDVSANSMSFQLTGGAGVVMDTAAGFHEFDPGAWSGGVAGLPHPLPVRPVRGQACLQFGAVEVEHADQGVAGEAVDVEADHDVRPGVERRPDAAVEASAGG